MKLLSKTTIPGFEIHYAEKGDEELIVSFIKALSVYEKLENEVVVTPKDLSVHLFGEKKVAEVLFGVYNSKPVGFALFFHNFSTFVGKPGIYLEDLFVYEEYRGKGFGKSLLTYLAKIAMERNCGRMEWAVLDWNEPSINFYKSLGARIMEEWLINRISGEKLHHMAKLFNS